MGGGQYNPRDSRQTGIDEDYDNVPRASPPAFTGYGDMLSGAIQVQNWLPPAMYHNDEPQQHGRAEPDHDHNTSDDLEELDNTDIDLNANISSPEANVEPVPSFQLERSRLASGPPSRRTLPSPSNPDQAAEIKKVKVCIRCRMQKMKVSLSLLVHPNQLNCLSMLNLCGSVNLTQRTFREIAWGAKTTQRHRKRRSTECHVIAARSQTPSCFAAAGFSLLPAGEGRR